MSETKKCKIFINTQPVIIIKDEYYNVDLYIPGDILKKNIAYIKGDYVYPYYGKVKRKEDIIEPGIYKHNDTYIFCTPSDRDKKIYSVDNIVELSTESIFGVLEKSEESFLQPEDLEVINNNSEIYTPMIKENDDFLKYIIKKAIVEKKINLRHYRGRFGNDYALNNMKSGLNKATKMTTVNFIRWATILGLDFEIKVWDSGKDNINPLKEEIIITSKDLGL